VSTERKPDPEAGGRYLMKLLAEDEAERIENLRDEEFLAERKAKGRDAWPTPSGEELIAKVKARAAREAQSASPSRDARDATSAGHEAPADGQRRALNGEGNATDADRFPQASNVVAPVVRLASRSRTRLVVSLLAAALAVAIVVVLTKGPEIVAAFHDDRPHEPIEPGPQEIAAQLRHDAAGLCAQGAWAACSDKLDEAGRLDPAGESDPDVQHLRTDIARVLHPPQQPQPDRPAP
jgi:hypothetical protein